MAYKFNSQGEAEKFYNASKSKFIFEDKYGFKQTSAPDLYLLGVEYFNSLKYLNAQAVPTQEKLFKESFFGTIPSVAKKKEYDKWINSDDLEKREIASKFYNNRYKNSFIESAKRLNLESLKNGLNETKNIFYEEIGNENKANDPVMATFGATDAEEPDIQHGFMEGRSFPLEDLVEENQRFGCGHDLIILDDEFIQSNFTIYK